jgi:hypothetical protein
MFLEMTRLEVMNKGKVVAIHALKVYRRNGGIVLEFLTLAVDGGEWLATPACCFTSGKRTMYPLSRRLGGSQSRFGHTGEKLNLLALLGFGPCSPVTILTALSWLLV